MKRGVPCEAMKREGGGGGVGRGVGRLIHEGLPSTKSNHKTTALWVVAIVD